MNSEVPVGSVCPFAGQVDPVSGSANTVWANIGCGSIATPSKGEMEDDAPLNYLEAQGWMLCDGRWLESAAYPELFAVLGFLYGQDSEKSTFRIPDYRGLFLRGADSGSGMDPDASYRTSPTGDDTKNVVGSLQCDAFQDHQHNYDITEPAAISQSGSAAGTSVTSKATSSPNTPARFSSETRGKNIAVSYIIKYR